MKWLLSMTLTVLAVLAPLPGAEAEEPVIPDSPQEIRPLLIGAEVPDVTLVTPDRRPVVLRELLATQPTILIYYRGGW